MKASIKIQLIDDETNGNTWVTVVPVEFCSPTGIRKAIEMAAVMLSHSLASDLMIIEKRDETH